jgi:hypothetical protein
MIICRWVAKVVLAGELPLVAERWIHSTSGPPIVHSIILHHLSLSSLVKQPLINRSNQEPASQKKKNRIIKDEEASVPYGVGVHAQSPHFFN